MRISTAPVATTKLLIGPTTEVRMSSSTGFLKFRGSTGVGLAHPRTGRWASMATAGRMQRPEQVNVLDGIERNPPQHACGRIAAQVGHPGVCRFVDADRKHESDQLKHDVQDVNMLQVHARLVLILTRGAAVPRGLRADRAGPARPKPRASAFPGCSAVLPARSTLP